MNIINNIAQIEARIPNTFYNQTIEQAKAGDPDWLLDLCMEHNNKIKSDSPFYISNFHDYFLHTEEFDTEAIWLTLKPLIQ